MNTLASTTPSFSYGNSYKSLVPPASAAVTASHFDFGHVTSLIHNLLRRTLLDTREATHTNPAPVAASIITNMGLGGHNLDTNALLLDWQKRAIQHVSVVLASISVGCCLISLYWFLLMRRNFRRTLIMLLLFADFWKSSWFLVFPAVSLEVGGIKTGTPFCDLGGFFLQTGIESCDVAILLMSLHMSLQVFNPTSKRIGPDGLYRYRHAVYVIWVVLPSFMAALAFVRTGKGSYLSQGAFCTLAIRPFWYRLALSWIPRYLIWIYITFTAIRIYLHVGKGFTVFAREVESGTNKTDQSKLDTNQDSPKRLVIPRVRRAASYVSETMAHPFGKGDHASRRPSNPHDDLESEENSCGPSPTKSSYKPSRDSLSPEAANYLTAHFQEQRPRQGSHFTTASSNVIDYGAAEIVPGPGTSGEPLVNIISTADSTAALRRRAIQRQTRLLFIYPCVYMIFMVLPFVQHCFTYSDYYAQHPVFAISILGPACYAVMGTADCLVFCWREKPWAAIPGSNGSFRGSFCFWRFVGPWADRSPKTGSAAFENAVNKYNMNGSAAGYNNNNNGNDFSATDPERSMGGSPDRPTFQLTDYSNGDARPGSSGSTTKKFLKTIKVIRTSSHRRAFSGHSDQAALAAERAAERLALERAAHAQRRSFLVEKTDAAETGKKEWFDREEELIDGEEEDDDDDDEGGDGEAAVVPDLEDGGVAARRRAESDLAEERERRLKDSGAI